MMTVFFRVEHTEKYHGLPLNFLYPHPVTQQSVYITFRSPLEGRHMGRWESKF